MRRQGWLGWRGLARQDAGGTTGFGAAGPTRPDLVWHGVVRSGMAGSARGGCVGQGPAWPGWQG